VNQHAHRAAAFVRVEETLLPAGAIPAALEGARSAPGLGERLLRLGAVGVGLPALGALALHDRRRALRLAGLTWRGLTTDRVEILAAERAELLAESARPGGLELIARARAAGHAIVLLSHGLEETLRPLARRLEADALLAGRLEVRDGVATGRVLEHDRTGRAVRWAEGAGVSLEGSYAYGSDLGDLDLLRRVGFPCAVNPDRVLRREAARASWPVLHIEHRSERPT
jgi:phosphoserine phosphatase